MTNETERRAQDKLTAALFRRTRLPLSKRIELEHYQDVYMIERQARRQTMEKHS